MPNKRTVFYLSDRTGITVETLGRSLLSQFDRIDWKEINIPFLDSVAKAEKAVAKINAVVEKGQLPPLIFCTLLDADIHDTIKVSQGIMYDFFDAFLEPMEQVLGERSSHTIGRSHSMESSRSYPDRISAVNYTLRNDDGISTEHFDEADIILIGVSRSGKTPTSLYFALLYGIRAANYPLTSEDMDSYDLPSCLRPYKEKLYGLTISPEHLSKIRQMRRPESHYASLKQCQKELQWQGEMYDRESIRWIDTTSISIEEIATKIIHKARLKRRLYG